ncbi:hypothetical protein [Moorena producens]|uniref:hypothetical protein n=1 Tax=Moorena producens TaxID=1155739 RepID=UPI000B0449FF|nr:hypothetical protein [Moorena producens]
MSSLIFLGIESFWKSYSGLYSNEVQIIFTLLPLASCLLPLASCLLPLICSLFPKKIYLT